MADWQGERGKKRCERDCTGTDEEARLMDYSTPVLRLAGTG